MAHWLPKTDDEYLEFYRSKCIVTENGCWEWQGHCESFRNQKPGQRAYSVFRDGAAWCATASGFVNLQESLAGFGDSPVIALGELIVAEQAVETERWATIRKWKCNCCNATFQCRHAGDGKTPGTGPACVRCNAYGQYTFEVLP